MLDDGTRAAFCSRSRVNKHALPALHMQIRASSIKSGILLRTQSDVARPSRSTNNTHPGRKFRTIGEIKIQLHRRQLSERDQHALKSPGPRLVAGSRVAAQDKTSGLKVCSHISLISDRACCHSLRFLHALIRAPWLTA